MESLSNPLYVQYGCGLSAPVQWINFDASPTLRLQKLPLGRLVSKRLGPLFPNNVRYGDIVKGLPVSRESCTAIYCSHVLEHLSLKDFEIALNHTLLYLKPGGTFRFVLPDLEMLARDYLGSTEPLASLRFMRESYLGTEKRERGLIGTMRGAIGNSVHLWMWDYRSMEQYLRKAGFVDIRRSQLGDGGDTMFTLVEDPGRWTGQLGVQCRRP